MTRPIRFVFHIFIRIGGKEQNEKRRFVINIPFFYFYSVVFLIPVRWISAAALLPLLKSVRLTLYGSRLLFHRSVGWSVYIFSASLSLSRLTRNSMSNVFDTPQGHQPSDFCTPLGTKNDENSISVRLSLSVSTCLHLNGFIPAPLHSLFFYFPSFTIIFYFRSLVHISSDWESKAETHDKTTHSWDVLFMRVGY